MFKIDLLENEKIVNVFRQTEAVLFKPILLIFILIYFPWYFLLKYELASSYVRLLFFWTILIFIHAVRKYLLWLLNVYLQTNQRLVSMQYAGLFSKKVLESPLDKILNVSFQLSGFWQAVFKYGDVEVQVAGLPAPIILKNVAQPSQIKDTLWRAREQASNFKI